MAMVKIYTSDVCPFCERAKAFLKERSIDFEETVLKPGTEEWNRMAEKSGRSLLPQIFIDDEAVGGYSDLVSLDAAGELALKCGLPLKEKLNVYDVIIIGGGPAGLSAAIYAARKVLRTLLISRNIGGQVTETWDIENYLGFSYIETSDLIDKFNEHVEKYGVEKIEGVRVTSLELTGMIKCVIAEEGKRYLARTVIIATGKHPRPLGVPGEQELKGKGVAYCSTCDAPLYADADVAVIGGGNSALEAAIDLEKIARRVYLLSLTPLTADKILQEKLKSSPKVEIYTEYKTTGIAGDVMVTGITAQSVKSGEEKAFAVEGIFIEIGLLPNSDIVIDALKTNSTGEIIIDERCQTGIPGVFACGDVTNTPYKQMVIAAGEGAKAALAVNDYLMNQR